ncbi:MAG TPA: TetR/AcrR family transcriptional regulator [Puia sp.]|nr:TetR/AcrR family transcriptional regulator [Puia sp.]
MKKKNSVRNRSAKISTEEKIKEAARRLFTQKGYAAVKTRDIAEEAGINLALLNYYFRSKEKLFNMIMAESLQQFILGIASILKDETVAREERMEKIVSYYIDMLTQYPDLPLFILSEMKRQPQQLASKFDPVIGSARANILKEVQNEIKEGKIANLHIVHFIANFIGLTVFPFVASPMLQRVAQVNDKQFKELMQERKKLIPLWIKTITSVK